MKGCLSQPLWCCSLHLLSSSSFGQLEDKMVTTDPPLYYTFTSRHQDRLHRELFAFLHLILDWFFFQNHTSIITSIIYILKKKESLGGIVLHIDGGLSSHSFFFLFFFLRSESFWFCYSVNTIEDFLLFYGERERERENVEENLLAKYCKKRSLLVL